MHGTSAAVGFHLYLMAQPVGLPGADDRRASDEFFGYFLDSGRTIRGDPAEVRSVYLEASARGAVDRR